MRRASKVDGTHRMIVKAFRDLQYSVLDLSRVGAGCPDLLVSTANTRGQPVTCLVECKMPKGKLNKRQLEFVSSWHGAIEVARSVDDVLAIHKRLML